MDNNCCYKKTMRSDEEKTLIKNRLNRISGQICGIQKMIDDDRYCDDVLIQLSAVNKSIKSLANHIIEKHMENCVVESIKKGDNKIVDEFITLIKRFQ